MAKNKVMAEFVSEQVKQLREENRFGTANNYEKTMASLMRFVGNEKLTFSSFDETLIADYNTYLIKRGLTRNTVSFYMRNLRAIYNKAVKQKIVVKKELFADVYTGIDKTRKRAVDEKVIINLYNLKLNDKSALALTRDIFIFSYCMRGMSFVDVAYLKKSVISAGMGHSSEITTQIYLKSIEDEVVDRANAEIINKLRINVDMISPLNISKIGDR